MVLIKKPISAGAFGASARWAWLAGAGVRGNYPSTGSSHSLVGWRSKRWWRTNRGRGAGSEQARVNRIVLHVHHNQAALDDQLCRRRLGSRHQRSCAFRRGDTARGWRLRCGEWRRIPRGRRLLDQHGWARFLENYNAAAVAGRYILMAIGGDAVDFVCRAGSARSFESESPERFADEVLAQPHWREAERVTRGENGVELYAKHLAQVCGVEHFECCL